LDIQLASPKRITHVPANTGRFGWALDPACLDFALIVAGL